MSRRPILLLALCLVAGPSPARAQDLLVVPFLGLTFGGDSSFFADLEQGSGETASALGASLMLMSPGLFGLEADFGWAPGFFERGDRQIVAPGSYVTSLTGSVVVAVPLSVTRESLRPYIVAGGGLLHADAEDFLRVYRIRSTMPAVSVGGGAIGMLSDSFGVRFDLRYQRSLGQGDELVRSPGPRLTFWRFGIGGVFRY